LSLHSLNGAKKDDQILIQMVVCLDCTTLEISVV